MINKVIKNCLSVIAYTIVFGLVYPLLYMESVLSTYPRIEYWISCFISGFVVHTLQIYFNELNPREMYYIIGIAKTSTAILLSTFTLILGLIWISIRGNTMMKVVFLISSFLIYLFLIYCFVHKGVAIYKRGKVRIFNFKIKTYQVDKIDDCIFEYAGKKCVIHIVVSGNDHIFKIPSASARLCEQRLKSIKCSRHK